MDLFGDSEVQRRREFLRGLARGAGLAGLGALVSVLAGRWARNGFCESLPASRVVCRRCPVFDGCSVLADSQGR